MARRVEESLINEGQGELLGEGAWPRGAIQGHLLEGVVLKRHNLCRGSVGVREPGEREGGGGWGSEGAGGVRGRERQRGELLGEGEGERKVGREGGREEGREGGREGGR